MITAAMLVLASFGCSEPSTFNPLSAAPDELEAMTSDNGNIFSEKYWVSPEGTLITAINGTVMLDFPRGAVKEPTLFTIASFPLNHLNLDGYNMMNRGIVIESTPEMGHFNVAAKIRLAYDLDGGFKSLREDHLTIYQVWGNFQAYENITPVKGCCVNPACAMIYACLDECGFYVVGEDK